MLSISRHTSRMYFTRVLYGMPLTMTPVMFWSSLATTRRATAEVARTAALMRLRSCISKVYRVSQGILKWKHYALGKIRRCGSQLYFYLLGCLTRDRVQKMHVHSHPRILRDCIALSADIDRGNDKEYVEFDTGRLDIIAVAGSGKVG